MLEPKPGEIRLWSDTLVRALFDADPHRRRDCRNLERARHCAGSAHHRDRARARGRGRDWERVWLTDWKSMRFGRRLWVCPTAGRSARGSRMPSIVRLDPGLAFGTGTHPTTALCLQILDSLPLSGPHA